METEIKQEKAPILRQKWYLYLTEFFSGMSVMAVELGASRLLAPYLHRNQFVGEGSVEKDGLWIRFYEIEH